MRYTGAHQRGSTPPRRERHPGPHRTRSRRPLRRSGKTFRLSAGGPHHARNLPPRPHRRHPHRRQLDRRWSSPSSSRGPSRRSCCRAQRPAGRPSSTGRRARSRRCCSSCRCSRMSWPTPIQARREGIEVEGITLWLLGGVAQLGVRRGPAGAEARIAGVGSAGEPGPGRRLRARRPRQPVAAALPPLLVAAVSPGWAASTWSSACSTCCRRRRSTGAGCCGPSSGAGAATRSARRWLRRRSGAALGMG